MPVLSSYTMKAFRFNLAEVVAIICCVSRGIVEVSGTPQTHTASDNREYLIETEYKYNWFEAFNECILRGSQLLTIDSEEKNTVIVNLLKEVIGESRNLWLGGNDAYSVDIERPFFWSTSGQEFTFTYWGYKEPNNVESLEHCVHIWFTKPLYRWNDNDCSVKMGFICEDNYYMETNKKELKPACDPLNKFNDDVFLKFEHLQKANINELNTRLQSLEQMATEEKSAAQKLLNISESSAEKLIAQQELSAKNFWEKLQNQGDKLTEQIAQTMDQINVNFDEKFNASTPPPYPVKNVIVIKQ